MGVLCVLASISPTCVAVCFPAEPAASIFATLCNVCACVFLLKQPLLRLPVAVAPTGAAAVTASAVTAHHTLPIRLPTVCCCLLVLWPCCCLIHQVIFPLDFEKTEQSERFMKTVEGVIKDRPDCINHALNAPNTSDRGLLGASGINLAGVCLTQDSQPCRLVRLSAVESRSPPTGRVTNHCMASSISISHPMLQLNTCANVRCVGLGLQASRILGRPLLAVSGRACSRVTSRIQSCCRSSSTCWRWRWGR